MVSLVTTLEVVVSDPRLRRKAFSHRASFGDVEDYAQQQITLARGETHTFTFDRYFFAHIRDIVDMTVKDADDNVVNFTDVIGMFALPKGGEVTLSVPLGSTISLNRVIHVMYG